MREKLFLCIVTIVFNVLFWLSSIFYYDRVYDSLYLLFLGILIFLTFIFIRYREKIMYLFELIVEDVRSLFLKVWWIVSIICSQIILILYTNELFGLKFYHSGDVCFFVSRVIFVLIIPVILLIFFRINSTDRKKIVNSNIDVNNYNVDDSGNIINNSNMIDKNNCETKKVKIDLSEYEIIVGFMVALIGQLIAWVPLVLTFFSDKFVILQLLSFFFFFVMFFILLGKNKFIESFNMNGLFNLSLVISWFLLSIGITIFLTINADFLPCHGDYCGLDFLAIPVLGFLLFGYMVVIVIFKIIIAFLDFVFGKNKEGD